MLNPLQAEHRVMTRLMRELRVRAPQKTDSSRADKSGYVCIDILLQRGWYYSCGVTAQLARVSGQVGGYVDGYSAAMVGTPGRRWEDCSCCGVLAGMVRTLVIQRWAMVGPERGC